MRTLMVIVVMGSLFHATEANAMETARPLPAPRRLVLCLDGTWNSPYDEHKRRDGHTVLRPTNPLKLCRAALPIDEQTGQQQITYYDIGVGSLAEYPGIPNSLLHLTDRVLGGAWGAGFEANVESALHFLALNYEVGDEVFIFGFSRGAATARAVTRFLEWNDGLPEKEDAYYLPVFFRRYVTSHGSAGERQNLLAQINADREREPRPESRSPLKPFRAVPVKYLGVWDTVMALGSRFESTGRSTSSPGRSFYAGTAPAACVRNARQALAIDEKRFDFRPEIWTDIHADQSIRQRWFAGVHSNIGGGYLLDGLANIAFRWILDGAIDQGLKIDTNYVRHFKAVPEGSLYDSSSVIYRTLDVLRFRAGRGRRQIIGANIEIDRSVIDRIRARPGSIMGNDDNPTMTPYRPDNVLQFLACQPDVDVYLTSATGVTDLASNPLPDDVKRRIAELRPRCAPPAVQKSASAAER
jgi:uncharacterized protein (DUF2235 family)